MIQEPEQIREQQKAIWNKFSAGWKKWDEFTMNFLRPMGKAIIEALELKEGDNVLDIATGTGEPGLTIAGLIGSGKVTGIDLSEGMLQIASENAYKKGILNYSTRLCDVTQLPFENDKFDAISCRMGFMFFPDMQVAANEIARVLKKQGRFATTVWSGPEKNPWVTAMMRSISKHVELPLPPAGAPGMFRCAEPGLIRNLLHAAGLKNIKEIEVDGQLDFTDSEKYWLNMNEIAAPVVNALSKATKEQREAIKKDLFDLLSQLSPGGKTVLNFEALVISGEK
jgi:ubiquinone/menaquinone biosynthesis C-methylase UbiE